MKQKKQTDLACLRHSDCECLENVVELRFQRLAGVETLRNCLLHWDWVVQKSRAVLLADSRAESQRPGSVDQNLQEETTFSRHAYTFETMNILWIFSPANYQELLEKAL